MIENFEKSAVDFQEKSPDRQADKNKKALMTRRRFLGGAGALAAGGAAAYLGFEKTKKFLSGYWDSIVSEIPPEEEDIAGQFHIEPESISKLINYDVRHIRLSPERIGGLKEYWKRRYRDYNDPARLNFKIKDSLTRMRPWDKKLKDVFGRFGMPPELRHLSIVESGFTLNARSPVGAVGPFQFTKKTAVAYGLRVDSSKDDRTDPVRSGEAAARLIKDLYEEIGDMNLALAAYNGGFVRAYLADEKHNPTYDGFLGFLENKINQLKLLIESGNFRHSALPGQTIFQIAKRYGVRPEELIRENGISGRILNVGEKLKIPFRGKDDKKKVFDKLTASFKENINFPHQVNAVMEVIKEGKM